MNSSLNSPTQRTQLTLADIDRVAANIAMTPPPARLLTTQEFVIAKKSEMLQCIDDGHDAKSLAAAIKANGMRPIDPRKLSELLGLPSRRKNKTSSTKKRPTSAV